MRAYTIEDAFGLDRLTLGEREAEEVGPGQVRLNVKAVSLNYRDLMVVRGQYNPRQPLPLVPCSDGAGVVDAIGPGVENVKVGDRVMSAFCPRWLSGTGTNAELRHAYGSPLDGFLREQAVVEAASLVPIDDALSFEQAATFPCAAVTAWHALSVVGKIMPGQSVLLLGTGGVSLFALQIAKMAGARVIITSSSDAKLEKAKALGADVCINYKNDSNWGKTARQAAGGDGVDVVVEVGGAGTLNQSLKAVRAGGVIAFIGVLSDEQQAPALVNILMNNIRLQGIYVGSRQMLHDVTRAFAVHGASPVVDSVFAFGDARAAFEKMAAGKHFGKIAINVAGA